MTHTLGTPRLTPDAGARTTRIGAALGLVSIVLIATGFAIAAATEATIASTESEIAAFYTGAGLARTLAGGLIEVLGLVLFLPFAVLLTGRLAAPGIAADLVAPTARAAATVYVAICLAPGMSAGAAALWLAHHGTTDPSILTALHDLRALSYFVALVPFAVFLVAAGYAGSVSRRLPRWATTSGMVLGVALAASVPFAVHDVPDMLGLLGLAWVVAVAVSLLRTPSPCTPTPSE
jgi:hypothetical protein